MTISSRFTLSILILCFLTSLAAAQNKPVPVASSPASPVANPDLTTPTPVLPTAAPVKAPSAASVESEKLSQQIRADERKMDFENTGLKWMPLGNAPASIWKFIEDRDPKIRNMIGTGWHVDFAVYDLDRNRKPDIALYFWYDCGNEGCLFKTFFDNENKNVLNFLGWEFVPYKQGIMLDRGYFSL